MWLLSKLSFDAGDAGLEFFDWGIRLAGGLAGLMTSASP
jgi:hypothetical protein